MTEAVFVRKNLENWKKFEQVLRKPRTSETDELARLYVALTDDLAYAQTYYKNTRTEQYLNQLALSAHQVLYKNKKVKKGALRHFFRQEHPLLLYKNRRYILYAFLIFSVSALMGALSEAYDSNFSRLILGDGYVNMTLDNIAQGDPMAVYKKANQADMFLGITYNNIRVSFLAYVAGIMASFGTGYILFSNGVMLGSFQYFFYRHDVLYESILSIWIHGTIEIWVIIVAGAAGLRLGNSWLFPGTYSRAGSLRRGAFDSVKIVMGLIPFFIVAGFLEGFVTRLTDMPDWSRIGIILASLALILWYFFIYPKQVYLQTLKN